MAEESSQDQDSKTEEPSEKRKSEFAKQGQVAFSREIGSTLGFTSIVLAFYWMMAWFFESMKNYFFFTYSTLDRWHNDVMPLYSHILPLLRPLVAIVGVIMAVAFVMPLIGHILQKGIEPKWEAAAPNFGKLNPIEGFKQIFSPETLQRTFANFLRVFGLMYIFYLTVSPFVGKIIFAAAMPFEQGASIFGTVFGRLLKNAILFLLTLAAVDYYFKWRSTNKKMMMSRQELKEEMKDSDGNPEVKSKIRQIQRERSKRKINKEVPHATVVVTNPTHFAVALRYKKGETVVPKVVAKGSDYLAKRIREVAQEHRVPIIENPPLARALFRDVKPGQEIPMRYYKAVAKIIAAIMRLENEKKLKQAQTYGYLPQARG